MEQVTTTPSILFHEAKSLPAGLDFGKAGKAIMDAMKKG